MNRKQRRFAKTKKGQKMGLKVEKLVDGKKSNQPVERTIEAVKVDPAEQQERLQKLLSGRLSSENEMVCYFVEKLRKVIAETDQLQKRYQQYQKTVTQLEHRLRELQGMQSTYAEDLKHWDLKCQETKPAEKGEAA